MKKETIAIIGVSTLATLIILWKRYNKSQLMKSLNSNKEGNSDWNDSDKDLMDEVHIDEDEKVYSTVNEEVGKILVVDTSDFIVNRAIVRYDGESYDCKLEGIPQDLISPKERVKLNVKYTFYEGYTTREIISVCGVPCSMCLVMDVVPDEEEL